MLADSDAIASSTCFALTSVYANHGGSELGIARPTTKAVPVADIPFVRAAPEIWKVACIKIVFGSPSSRGCACSKSGGWLAIANEKMASVTMYISPPSFLITFTARLRLGGNFHYCGT